MGARRKRTAGGHSELRLPTPLLEYLFTLPGDYVKIALRLLQRAKWVPGVTEDGVELDSGEVLISSRSSWLGSAIGRELGKEGLRSLIRRVLDRLEEDGYIARRPAHPRGPGSDPPRGPGGSTHPPTIVRFLRFRTNLWPANRDPAHPPGQEGDRDTTQACGPLLSVVDPPDPPGPPEEQAPPGPEGRASESRKSGNGTAPNDWPILLFGSLFSELRGGTDRPQWPRARKDAKALLAYPEASRDEIEARMRRYFTDADAWTIQNASFSNFVHRWSNLDGIGSQRAQGTARVAQSASADAMKAGNHGF